MDVERSVYTKRSRQAISSQQFYNTNSVQCQLYLPSAGLASGEGSLAVLFIILLQCSQCYLAFAPLTRRLSTADNFPNSVVGSVESESEFEIVCFTLH